MSPQDKFLELAQQGFVVVVVVVGPVDCSFLLLPFVATVLSLLLLFIQPIIKLELSTGCVEVSVG